MAAQKQITEVDMQTQDDAFEAEFSAALADLLGKMHFRGKRHQQWIAQQIVDGLSEEPEIRQHLANLLLTSDEHEKETA